MLSEVDNNMEFGVGSEEHHVGSCNNNNNEATHHVIKGKRTKRRLRPLSPTPAAVTSSCSSASCGGGGASFSSTTFEGTDQEEEDMANCLILLAQGKREAQRDHQLRHQHHHHACGNNNKVVSFSNHITSGERLSTERSMKNRFDIYECKTCNRTFPSFQALGGHRASHKKPKKQQEKKLSPPPQPLISDIEEANYKQIIIESPPPRPMISLELGCGGISKITSVIKSTTNKGNKIHECSICGSEFTSGQALGGHMRRHRASNNNNNVVSDNIKSRNVLELDLNLPAPPEDDDLLDFQFPATTQKSVVLSPALVGCHY